MKIAFSVAEDDLGTVVSVHESIDDKTLDRLITALTQARFSEETVRYARVESLPEEAIEFIDV